METTTREPAPIFYLEHVGPYPEIGPVFERLMEVLKQNNIEAREWIGVWLDDPQTTPEAELRSWAAASVAPGTECPAECKQDELPGGKYVMHRYEGPYEGLGEAWGKFAQESDAEHGDNITAPCFEVYVTMEPPVTDLYSRLKA